MSQQSPTDPIQPKDIPLTQPQPAVANDDSQSRPKPLVFVGLAVTGLLALAVIFVLPELVSDRKIELPEEQQAEASKPSAAPQVLESPFQEAQLAQARRNAQDILAKLLESQKFLQSKSVELWAAERYQQATDRAAEADVAFRERLFDDALTGYQDALATLTELEQQVESTLANALEQGMHAIDSGDANVAQENFQLALAIEPGNNSASTGLARAATLDTVLETLAKAQLAWENGELDQAVEHVNSALALDSKHRGAQQTLADLRQQILERDYISALSRGYSHLENGMLSNASNAFKQALALRPSSSEAQRGLTQAKNRQTRKTLQQQLSVAAQREQEENWQAAETLYNQVLNKDSSVVEARSGQIRSSVRAELDENLQNLIDNSMRLTSSNVYQDATQLLQQARGIDARGPRLNRQIASLQTALIKAATPWPVELQSDNATKVTLFRVGELGSFSTKTLKLKPGRYVATGSRKGYRDVRIEFTITGTAPSGPIIIKCKDII
ncbi:hypothetical protein KFE80_06880 [bacterium SCSIO 12696]|nr:hypothetical protein KFE80_06880 [bacterium SCSIO 12696]